MRRSRFIALAGALTLLPLTAVANADAPARPARVTHLAAYQQNGAVQLAWTTPREADRVVVRYARGTTAPAPHTGSAPAVHGRGFARLDDLAPGMRYTAAVWNERDGRLSAPAISRFTTKAPVPALATIGGVVVDRAGDPLQHVRIIVTRSTAFDTLKTVYTNDGGGFRVRVPAGTYDIEADGTDATGGPTDATGYTGAFRAVTVGVGQTRHTRFRFGGGGAIRGVVTDAAGNPLEGVLVTWKPPVPYVVPDGELGFGYDYLDAQEQRTDAHGRYVLNGLPAYGYLPCYDPTHATGGNHDRLGYVKQCADEAISAVPYRTIDFATVALQPSRRSVVTGTVTDAHGRPVPHADVSFSAIDDLDGAYPVVDAHGRYRVVGLSAGRWLVCAKHEPAGRLGLALGCRTITVRRHAVSRADVRLGRGAALTGRIVDPSGNGIGGLPVKAVRSDAHNQQTYASAVAYTKANGEYTLGGMQTGQYRVCIQTPATASRRNPTGLAPTCLGYPVDLVAGRNRIGADRTLAAGGAVTGTIAHRPPGPLFVDVEQQGAGFGFASGRVHRDGTYKVTGLAPGRYRVCTFSVTYIHAYRGTCVDHVVTLAGGRTTRANFAYPSLAGLTVHVTDRKGRTLRGANVAVLHSCPEDFCPVRPVFDSDPVRVSYGTVTWVHGKADFGGLDPGRYAVCVFGYYATRPGSPTTGYSDACDAHGTFPVTITQGRHTSLTIQLPVGGTVTGRVTDPHGHAIRHARVTLTGSPVADIGPHENDSYTTYDRYPIPSPRSDVFTDVTGRYRIHSVQAGDQQLCGEAGGYTKDCLADPVSVDHDVVVDAPNLVLTPRAGAGARASLPTPHVRVPRQRFAVLDGHLIPEPLSVRG